MVSAELAMVVATVGILIATLVSPCLAVQVQKWIEESKEKKRRKMWIFATLMTTRASRTANEHVMALNSIDLTFNKDTKKEKAIVNAWRTYFDHLCNTPDEKADHETFKQKQGVWEQKKDDLFVDLLKCLSDALDYNFDTVQLKRGFYYPRAHDKLEMEHSLLRSGLIEVIAGRPLSMKVTNLPFSPKAFELQQKLNEALLKALSDGSLQVIIKSAQEK